MTQILARPGTGRRRLTLFLLAVIYLLNFLDRQIILILQEPIRHEFGLSDTQLGLMTGGAFGLLYTSLGLPLARWLDRGVVRVRFIAGITALWSLMTIICGVSRNFPQLFLVRMGVGMAEAGFTPAAHSLLSDMYAPRDRPQAIGLFAISVPIGSMAGLAIGGMVAQAHDWRVALFVGGVPGLLVALLFAIVAREPDRGGMDSPATGPATPQIGTMRSIALLMRRAAFRHIVFSASVCGFAQAGIAAWLPSFLIRVHGMPIGQVGIMLGLLLGLCGVIGTYAGGWQATRMARAGEHRMLLLPMAGALASIPLLIWALAAPSGTDVALRLIVPLILGGLWTAPSIALTQNLAPVTMRAQASALYVICANLIGVSMGPLAVGLLSDVLAGRSGDAGQGLRQALVIATAALLWGALHHALAIRAMARERRGATDPMA